MDSRRRHEKKREGKEILKHCHCVGNRGQKLVNYTEKEQPEPLGGRYNGKNDIEGRQVNGINQTRKLTMMRRGLSVMFPNIAHTNFSVPLTLNF